MVQNNQLENAFVSLLQEIAPDSPINEDLTREFAGKLVEFANEWVTNPEGAEQSMEELDQWIQSNVCAENETTTDVMYAEAEQ